MPVPLRYLLLAVVFLSGLLTGMYATAVAREGHAQSQEEVVILIHEAADRYGLSPAARRRALAIGWCESRYVATARNAWSNAIGVFQFVPGTARSVGINPWDAEANIDAALRLMAAGQWQHWRACW